MRKRLPPIDKWKESVVEAALKSSEAVSTAPGITIKFNGTLDELLSKQLAALDKITNQLVIAAGTGNATKDEIQSLATCIKLTMDLKVKENEILENLSDEDLTNIIKDVD